MVLPYHNCTYHVPGDRVCGTNTAPTTYQAWPSLTMAISTITAPTTHQAWPPTLPPRPTCAGELDAPPAWRQPAVGGVAPDARNGHSLTWDAEGSAALLFGGADDTGTVGDDTGEVGGDDTGEGGADDADADGSDNEEEFFENIPPEIAKDSWSSVQKNIGKFQQVFGNDMFVIDNSDDSDVMQRIQEVEKTMRQFLTSPPNKKQALDWIQS